MHEQETCTLKSPSANDLNELKCIENINVWSRDQTVLEGQALTEIEIFNKKGKEDGELSEQESDKTTHSTTDTTTLDIDKYIKNQEELKKKLKYKRSVSVSEKSKNAASKIQLKLNNKRKSKKEDSTSKAKKLKISESTSRSIEDKGESSGSEYFPSDFEDNDDCDYEPSERSVSNKTQRRKLNEPDIKQANDDGDISFYKERLDQYYKLLECESSKSKCDEEDVEVCTGFKINARIWNNLYSYQQDGIEWLYDLHIKSTGGLLGDEMGLGKTVQVIAFLYGLSYSRTISKYCRYTGLGPTIIVCPTTVIHQWVQHFHIWAPEFRIAVLHQSGSYTGNRLTLIKEIFNSKGIIVTSYQGVLKYKGHLVELDWHYIILDEGHKIRNPTAKITVAVKQFRTPHKLMLTGSPMQNNLQELWSLFDFICPSLLGTLPVFVEHFAMPIMHGGYSNATPIQETTALLMAKTLKNMITPYLLRRSKDEVKTDICLPQKSEQVLFCSLTDEQHDLYKGFLMSEHINALLGKGGKNWFSQNHMRANVLVAITTLRKICNHPDLYLEDAEEQIEDNNTPIEESFGYYKRSGKMVVVSALLKIWKKQNHRVLLFTQGRAMITILENFLKQQEYKYLKMDGGTNVKSRQKLIKTFNEDTSYHVFLLTTRVGGLGINLTGADRVIIYDPDWNPATDTQARERAWRIGQDRQVTIYRLISAGTIEEKMYQRQVWKQLLSNKVLLDPKTQKFFKTSDLHDLFSIQDKESSSNPETANIFKNSRISMEERLKEKQEQKKKKKDQSKTKHNINFSHDKIEQMRKLAQEISKKFEKNKVEPLKKSTIQVEMEEDREKKEAERKYMKTLTPSELLEYNKKKLLPVDDTMINKIDLIETGASFSKVLEVAEKASDIYHKVKEEKLNIDKGVRKYDSLTKPIKKKESKINQTKKKAHESKHKTVDGEEIEFLVKKELHTRKESNRNITTNASQDQYVLEKLFSKKGVHTALQHDVIVDGRKQERPNRFRVDNEAQQRTDLALLALRKCRLNNWGR